MVRGFSCCCTWHCWVPLKSDIKHLFDISCMTGCTILLGTCAPRKRNPPSSQQGLLFYQPPRTGDQAAVWGCPSRTTCRWKCPNGQPCVRAARSRCWAGRQLKPSSGLHTKQEWRAEANLYNEIWDSNLADYLLKVIGIYFHRSLRKYLQTLSETFSPTPAVPPATTAGSTLDSLGQTQAHCHQLCPQVQLQLSMCRSHPAWEHSQISHWSLAPFIPN